ncbi:FtsK/SpoIIIE domain-containing protein, partial [Streptococcus agalactiae]
SRFKLALKVADRGDSMEMLHTPDAAEITQAGRAYLQVGNNEVYELFQSAWSGADYQPEKDDQGIEDHTIYSINDLGQYEILNDDLSGLDQAENIKEVPTELDAIVENIQALTKEMGISDLPQPWLPPLSNQISVTDLRKEESVDLWSKAPSYKAVLGFMDIPSQQAQEVAYHDFEDDGHLSIFAGPSMGKSTALQTVTMDLARHNSPEFLNLYLFDFGTNGLLPLRRLPHVADFFTIDDDEKIAKFIARIKVEMSDRKKALSRYNVATAKLYRQVSGETMPQILIVIDSYEGLREAQTLTNLEACFQNISRDGSSLGISLVISAGRMAALRSSLMANLKERIALKLTDDSESRTLVGRHQHIMEDIPGRGLIKRDDIEVLQVALPTEGTETFDIISNIQTESDAMNDKWTGPRPKAIPIVPEELTFDDFMATDSVQADLSANRLPLGLEMIDVESYGLALNRFKHMLYMSDSDESLEAVGSHIIKVLLNVPNYHTMIIDSLGEYESYQSQVRTYVGSDMIEDMADQLIYELQQRESQSEIAEWFIMIPDFENFAAKSNMKLEQVQALFDNGPRYGLHLILGSSYNYVGTKIDAVPKYVRTTVQYVLAGMRLMDQTFLEKVYNSKEIRPNKDEAYIHDRKNYQKLKLTID